MILFLFHKLYKWTKYSFFSILFFSLFVLSMQIAYQDLLSRRMTKKAKLIIEEGVKCSNKKLYKMAFKLFERVIDLGEKNASAYFCRAKLYESMAEYELSIADYTNAINIDPRYYEAFNRRGIVHHSMNNLSKAINDFSKAIHIFPNYCESIMNRCLVYKEKKDYGKALEDIDRLPNTCLNKELMFVVCGEIYFEKGNMIDAINCFNKAIEINPNNYIAFVDRAKTVLKMGLHEQVISDCDSAIVKARTDDNLLPDGWDLTEIKIRKIKGKAERYISTSVRKKRNANYCQSCLDAIALNNAGLELLKKGAFVQAIKKFNKAILLSPSLMQAFYNRGLAFNKIGDIQKSIVDFSRTVLIDKECAEAYKSRARICSENRLFEQAIFDYSEALRINHKDPSSFYNRANCYVKKGEIKKAIIDLNNALNLEPMAYEALNERGKLLFLCKQIRKAISDFDAAIALHPNYYSAYINRGSAKVEMGAYRNAIDDFDIAIEIKPQEPIGYDNRGAVYIAHLKMVNKGCSDWKRSCELGRCYNYKHAKRSGVCK